MKRLACIVLLLSGCSTAKPEAASLVAGVDRFHRASNDERPARADALTQADVRGSRGLCRQSRCCVAATTATATALRLKHEAELLLHEVEGGRLDRQDPEVVALPAKLDRASALLEKGHDKMPACDQKVLILRERYGSDLKWSAPSDARGRSSNCGKGAPRARSPCLTHWRRASGRRRIASPA